MRRSNDPEFLTIVAAMLISGMNIKATEAIARAAELIEAADEYLRSQPKDGDHQP